MIRLPIKPLSINEAYRGRRFATKDLDDYKKQIGHMLPPAEIPNGPLSVIYTFGVSSKRSDGDNLIKCLQDAIADRYGFDDKKIYEWHICKVDVKKGQEFIEFEISTIKQ